MDLSTMTLAEFFALAEKVGGAARTIREAQAMMGGPRPVAPPTNEDLAAELDAQGHHGFATTLRVHHPPRPAPAVQWSPAEMAERERLRLEREAGAREAEKAVLESRS